jgi:hypothetical protein
MLSSPLSVRKDLLPRRLPCGNRNDSPPICIPQKEEISEQASSRRPMHITAAPVNASTHPSIPPFLPQVPPDLSPFFRLRDPSQIKKKYGSQPRAPLRTGRPAARAKFFVVRPAPCALSWRNLSMWVNYTPSRAGGERASSRNETRGGSAANDEKKSEKRPCFNVPFRAPFLERRCNAVMWEKQTREKK